MAGPSEVSRLVQATVDGGTEAWNELVRRYAPLVMAVARSYQLAATDAQDVSQTVWLRLVEHLAELRAPDALPGWLVTTTQRECRRQVSRARRTLPMDPQADGPVQQCPTADPDANIPMPTSTGAARRHCRATARDQWPLRLRATDPPSPITRSATAGDAGRGIGTLRRCLARLRETHAVRSYLTAGPGVGRGKAGDQRELTEVE